MDLQLLADGAQNNWLPSRVVRALGAALHKCPDLRRTAFADVVISGIVGRGRRCPLGAFLRRCSGPSRNLLFAELRSILDGAHRAGLFDLDLHQSNIIVTRQPDGAARPVLFDFNKVPYHVRPPNALFGVFLKLGLIRRRSRDHRQWKRSERLRPDRLRVSDEDCAHR